MNNTNMSFFYKTITTILGLYFLLVMTGCAAKRVKMGDPVIRDGYGYIQEAEKEWLVFVLRQTEFEKAKQEIGCGICTTRLVGWVYGIERVK